MQYLFLLGEDCFMLSVHLKGILLNKNYEEITNMPLYEYLRVFTLSY